VGLYYEDFEPGRVFATSSREVTEADVRAFAELSGDRNPIHLDPGFAARTEFGRPVAHGVLGLAVVTGLASGLELTRETLVALVGLTWRFLRPIMYGDTLSARLVVDVRRETSQPDRGLVTFAIEVTNQHGEVVQTGELVELVRRRAARG
jgi:acyl dehydratase